MQTGCMVGLRPAVGGSTRPSANFQIHSLNADSADWAQLRAQTSTFIVCDQTHVHVALNLFYFEAVIPQPSFKNNQMITM